MVNTITWQEWLKTQNERQKRYLRRHHGKAIHSQHRRLQLTKLRKNKGNNYKRDKKNNVKTKMGRAKIATERIHGKKSGKKILISIIEKQRYHKG